MVESNYNLFSIIPKTVRELDTNNGDYRPGYAESHCNDMKHIILQEFLTNQAVNRKYLTPQDFILSLLHLLTHSHGIHIFSFYGK